MRTSLLVVDDFIDGAEGLREAALGLTFPNLEGPFPGRNSLQRINLEGLADQVSDLVREPLEPISPPRSHGKCRLTLASDPARARVHIDPSHWSGILYLSRPQDCRGGTDFYRHLPTGSEHAPVDAAELHAMGFTSFEDVHREIVAKDGLDESKWERTMSVPMRFNRLVLLRPWLWHTAGPGFGDDVVDGRLVYLMFFSIRGR
jgi:Family of unknown function (DUF6445)